MRLRRKRRPGFIGAARALFFRAFGPFTPPPPPFTPGSLSDVWLWLEAGPTWCFSDSGGTVPCAAGDLVYIWKDQSGNGHDLSQATSGNRPTLIQVSGQWRVQFGVGKYMTGASITTWPTSTGFMSIRMRFNTASHPQGGLFETVDHAGNGDYFRYDVDGQAYPRNFLSARYSGAFTAPDDTNPHTYTQVSDADYRLYVDAVQQGTTQPVSFESPTGFVLGATDLNFTPYYFDGEVGAIVVGASSLSGTDQTNLENYLQPKLTNALLHLVSTAGTLKSGSVFTQTNGDALVTWQDQSGNGFDFTASNGPTILTGQQNGLPAIHLASTSSQKFQRTDAGASSLLNLTGDFTISFVVKMDSWADGDSTGVIGKKITDGVDGWQIYNDGDQPSLINMRINGSNNFFDTTNVSTSVAQLFTFQRSGSTGSWYVNGTLSGSGSVPTGNSATAAPINIGFSETWSGYLNGKLYEIYVFDSAISLTDLHTSLMTKYAL